MSDGCTAGCTGETSVGDQCDILIQLHASQCRGRVQHLTHARTTLRAFIADDDYIALVDSAVVDGINCLFLAVKDTCRTGMLHHFRCHSALLDCTAFLCNVAPQNRNAAGLHIRVVNRTDDIRVAIDTVCNVLANHLAGCGDGIQLNQILLGQLIHNSIDAASLIQFLNIGTSCRCQVAQIRGLVRNLIHGFQIKVQTSFMSNGQQMQYGIGRAAQCHFTFQCIVDGFFVDDITGLDVLFQQLHDLHAGMLCQLDAVRMNCRNGAVARQCHTNCFTQAIHRVCGIHAGAGTATRAGMAFHVVDFFISNQVCLACANGLKGIGQGYIFTLHMTSHHRTAGNNNRRDIQACCCHNHARYDLITVRDQDQCIKLMCLCQCLNRVRNQLTGRQRILHTQMTHGNAITYTDCRYQNRGTASHADTGLNCCCNLVQIDMTRNDFAVSGNHTDNRLTHFFFGQTAGTQQGTVRNTFHTLCNIMTSQFHINTSKDGSIDRRIKNRGRRPMLHPRYVFSKI